MLSCVLHTSEVSLLWFNFILYLNFIFFCCRLSIIHNLSQKQWKTKWKLRMKLIEIHVQCTACTHCGVFIDLEKAFDTFDHNILLDKLNFYSFHGLINQWFSSYLNNRTQTTQIADHISNKASIKFGVPQKFRFRSSSLFANIC